MITPADKALAETTAAALMPMTQMEAQREYRRLDALTEALKREVQTPSVLADREAVLVRKAEIFQRQFRDTLKRELQPQP